MKMKLSYAMKVGTAMRPGSRWSYFARRSNGSLATDALAAAMEAVRPELIARAQRNPNPERMMIGGWQKHFPELLSEAYCPIGRCADHYTMLINLIIHLQEEHGRSRTWIAWWLEGKGL